MPYYTCELLSKMGQYNEFYVYVKDYGGQYYNLFTEEIKMKLKIKILVFETEKLDFVGE